MTNRIQHAETHAEGTVLKEFAIPAERAGDCAGLWYTVQFDDGLICDVPAVLTERVPDRELFPQWLHEHQVLTLTANIERETRQREELVKWIERIDSDVLGWMAERLEHQFKLDHGIYTKPEDDR
jgi:hypothetical protein